MTNTATKFTARNLPALIAIAQECGLTFSFRHSSKCYSFAPGETVDGDFPALSDEDQAKLVQFSALAEERFGTRENFSVSNRWRFVRVTWERDTRTEAQLENRD